MTKMTRLILAYLDSLRRLKHYLNYEPHPIGQIFYLLLVVGGYGAFVLTGLPHLPNAFVGESHTILSAVAVGAAFVSFLVVCTTPAGPPYTKCVDLLANYEYDNVLYTPSECSTCKVVKVPRSKHCRVCNTCVPRFDHHCVWINDCVGELNHGRFLIFLATNVVLCVYGSYLLFYILYGEFVQLQDQQFVDVHHQLVDNDIVVQLRYLIHAEAPVFVLWVVCTFMGLALVVFFLFHCYLACTNLTTNEFFKWRAIRAHNRQDTRRHHYNVGSVFQNVYEVFSPRFYKTLEQRRQAHAGRAKQE